MASARLCRASSLLRPSPFAPGTSGQYAMVHSPSCSKIAVNALLMLFSSMHWKTDPYACHLLTKLQLPSCDLVTKLQLRYPSHGSSSFPRRRQLPPGLLARRRGTGSRLAPSLPPNRIPGEASQACHPPGRASLGALPPAVERIPQPRFQPVGRTLQRRLTGVTSGSTKQPRTKGKTNGRRAATRRRYRRARATNRLPGPRRPVQSGQPPRCRSGARSPPARRSGMPRAHLSPSEDHKLVVPPESARPAPSLRPSRRRQASAPGRRRTPRPPVPID